MNLRSQDMPGVMPKMDRNELATLMREVIREELVTALDNKLQPIQQSIDALRTEMTENAGIITSLEDHATEIARRPLALEESSKTTKDVIVSLKQKVERLENHSRKFNIRVLGLPEGIERGNPTSFVTTLLNSYFMDRNTV